MLSTFSSYGDIQNVLVDTLHVCVHGLLIIVDILSMLLAMPASVGLLVTLDVVTETKKQCSLLYYCTD